MTPRLLDLFCGAGGAAMGYHRAGFDVTGVDIHPQKRYPFHFIQGDALSYLCAHGSEYDVIHASPPCQSYSVLKHMSSGNHPELVDETRTLLQHIGRPWVIENVPGAPLRWPLLLCGSMFGLQTSCGAELRRHRLFESSMLLMSPGACQHGRETIMVVGDKPRNPQLERVKYRPVISVHGGKARDRPKKRTISINGHEFRSEASRYAERLARTITVTGSTPQQNLERSTIRETFSITEARRAMGIDWMVMRELSQAIPPAYTAWVGTQLLASLRRKHPTQEDR